MNPTGETLGAAGPLGSGKSVRMMIIAGHALTRGDEGALPTFRRRNVGILFPLQIMGACA